MALTVIRTGGFAGLRRQWDAEPAADEAPDWVELIEQCPWDVTFCHEAAVDRFTWRIEVRCGPEEHSAQLAESQVTGPWLTLVDAVRAHSAPPSVP